jgi:hypothetical protein
MKSFGNVQKDIDENKDIIEKAAHIFYSWIEEEKYYNLEDEFRRFEDINGARFELKFTKSTITKMRGKSTLGKGLFILLEILFNPQRVQTLNDIITLYPNLERDIYYTIYHEFVHSRQPKRSLSMSPKTYKANGDFNPAYINDNREFVARAATLVEFIKDNNIQARDLDSLQKIGTRQTQFIEYLNKTNRRRLEDILRKI